ncbi:hypothetical protein LPTSP4_26200 [Leptospira ryugenii]|uniref:Probable membrane transporter protein n=1 Tax=Leptospira ryugenii TaxID=1917863 RepID=A0A2P2E2J9_9LEPT|nr:sulfite exporter TauE/SafE family protein [Leptospira ryugenii]GBF51089.1 hypothetical protein LPTSP4_26200 [Leptospira ryugenii]
MNLFDFGIFSESSFGLYPGLLIVLCLGFFVGYLSSFLGIGGGFIYTPFFHTFFHLSAVQAVAVSLAQMPLSALSGLFVYFRGGKIRFAHGFLLLITSIPTALYIADRFGKFEDTELGKKIVFGLPLSELVYLFIFTFFLSVLGIWNLVSAERKKKKNESTVSHSESQNSEKDQRTKNRQVLSVRSVSLLLAVGIAFGATSSLLGIGGGFLAVPLFVYYFRMEPIEAVATSFLGIFFTSMGTTVWYFFQGKLIIELALVGTAGGWIGARLGSMKAIRSKPYVILRVLGGMQLIVVTWYAVSKVLGK